MVPRVGIDVGSGTIKTVVIHGDSQVHEAPIQEIRGQPLHSVRRALADLLGAGVARARIGVTGAGAPSLCDILGVTLVDEYTALAAATDLLYPDVRTLVEMGQESQKLITLQRDEASGRLLVNDIELGNKCAAGSGSFLAHMYKRLNYPSLDALAEVACKVESPASLSGRCAVFTESDIVHLYQKGTARERIAAGVHQAMCRNFKSALVKGADLQPRVAFIGGVAQNPAMVKFMAEELGVAHDEILVPKHFRTMGAIGAALRAETETDVADALEKIEKRLAVPFEYAGLAPLALDKSTVLQPPLDGDTPPAIECAALGVDIGSVSTKAALITEVDGEYRILAKYYRRTDGDPLAAVRDTLARIHEQVKARGYEIKKIVAATTGSGRYLTGDYIGADLVKNEITAQASGATTFVQGVDSIFEIGGQDSKFVRLNGDTIVDFEMNKACAAGTGAFLEKIAGHLNVAIEEFGDVALKAKRPPDLDWQCTVFSESAILYYQQNNVPREELAAGTCLASVKNYLNKNVGNRDVGERIVFQGAVAFNKGMVAAMETVLGREIIVPPNPHLTGAVGAARIAYENQPEESRFRGFEAVTESKYVVRSFECKKCPNRCDVNTFQLEGGPKYFYNDRCERYSGVHARSLGDGLPDLFAEREQMLLNAYVAEPKRGAERVGIPRGLLFNDYFPLFNAFFSELGYEVVVSDPTNAHIVELGVDAVVGEPCFPMKVAHGHPAAL
ncbi:MAG: acyl-CoA dehydratase activase, partial [Armatimonadota bacterium]